MRRLQQLLLTIIAVCVAVRLPPVALRTAQPRPSADRADSDRGSVSRDRELSRHACLGRCAGAWGSARADRRAAASVRRHSEARAAQLGSGCAQPSAAGSLVVGGSKPPRLSPVSTELPASVQSAQHRLHRDRLMARGCAGCASHTQHRCFRAPLGALHGTSERRQCDAHRPVLVVLLDTRHLLAPCSGGTARTGLRDPAVEARVRRASVSQRPVVQPRVRPHCVRAGGWRAHAIRRP